MRRSLVLIAAGAALLAGSASAQSWSGYNSGVRAQMDRPGDFRCDAFWDANRTDCDAGWRDQRRYTSWNAGSGHGHRSSYRPHRGYGSAYAQSYGQSGTAYYGAYGRPDLVYPGGGYASGGYASGGYASGGRDARRIDWCRANYRSYDPSSGYYRAYSGRLVWCG
jgi:hypothetical protein